MTIYRLSALLTALALATSPFAATAALAAAPADASAPLKAITGGVPITPAMQPKIDELLAAIAANKATGDIVKKPENEAAWLAIAGGAYPPNTVRAALQAVKWGHRSAGMAQGSEPQADDRVKTVFLARSKESEPAVRYNAFLGLSLFLGVRGDADVVQRIADVYKDKASSAAVKALAIGQLSMMATAKVPESAQWLDLVLAGMADGDAYVRLSAINSLYQFFWTAETKSDAAALGRVQKALETALKSKDPNTRASAAHATVTFAARTPKHQAALKPTILAFFKDKQSEVRAAAAAAVADVPLAEGLALLEPLLDDKGAGAAVLTGGKDLMGQPWTFNTQYAGSPAYPFQVRDFAVASARTRAQDLNAPIACDDSAPADDAAGEKQTDACVALVRAFLKNPPAPPAE